MKIDKKFNAKEIANMFVDVARIFYKYRITRHYKHEYLKSDNNLKKVA